MKRLLVWAFAAIVVMSALTSCDKDEYVAAEPQPYFFKIMDETHINLYDQYGVLWEEMRETEFSIRTQFPQNFVGNTPLEILDSNDRMQNLSYRETDDVTADGGLTVLFKYNYFENILRVYGLHIEGKNALGETFEVFCLDDVYIRSQFEIIDEEPAPYFSQTVKIHYTLEKDTLTLAEAFQDVDIKDDSWFDNF